MQKKVLNNKIGIQILTIIAGIGLLVFGILSISTSKNATDIYPGCAMMFVGVILVIAGAIKIANYEYIKEADTMLNAPKKNAEEHIAVNSTNTLEAIRDKIAYLQQMKSEGLISEKEFETMRISFLEKMSGSAL